MNCRSCGFPLAPEARFCSNCGASQATAEEERRIITAVFADIVGFTALAEHRDPEEVKHLVDRTFALLSDDVTAFGGVVDKIVGDQIVALFGAPVAHSDDAERAVRAALRMQATIAGLDRRGGPAIDVRIGINTGEVLVGSTTTGGDYTAMGDVMNSASRLQDLAKAGQVIVGEATRNATGDAVRYESCGDLAARGREVPIQAWLALEATGVPGARRRKADAFVGRERELAFLDAQAMMAVELSTAQLALILGEAGMGKTRLIQEASKRLAERVDLRIFQGRCVAYGEANVWWPIGEVIRDVYDLDPAQTKTEAEVALRAALTERFGQANPEVTRWLTALLHALGYDTSLRGGERNRNRSEVTLAVAHMLEHELRDQAVVVILTDMQWAADAVWSLLDHLLGELSRTRLFIMASAQTFEHDDVFVGRHGTAMLRLGPLRAEDAKQLLAEVGADLDADALDGLVDRSGGNPYFLEELADFVRKNGDLEDSEGAGATADLDDLPDTLRGIVAARLDSLDAPERALIEDASVLGRSGSVRGLATLVREVRGVESIEDELAALVEHDLLAINGPRYEFQSDLVRDVAYGTLTKTVRAQRHAGIADYLSQEPDHTKIRNSVAVAIAEHYRASAQLSSEVSFVPGLDPAEVTRRALYWLDQAGRRALDVGEPVQAERWFDRGLELATDDELIAGFLFGRATARSEIHDIPGARADLDRLDPLVERDPVLAAKALMVRGDVDRKAGDLDRAAGELREAADRLAVLDVPGEQAQALRLLGITEMDRSDDSLATQALTSSRRVAAKAGDRRSEAWALQSLALHAFVRGQATAADELVGQAIDIFVELGDRSGLAWAQGVQAWVAFHLGEWDTARDLLASVLPEARRRGDPSSESIMLNLSASLSLWSGQAAEAEEIARRARAAAERADDEAAAIQSLALEGRAMVSQGRIAEGTDLLERAFLTADRLGDRDSRRIAIISNCASAARLGEPERAIRWAARYDGDHDDPANVGEVDLLVSLALAMLQRGAVAEAESQLSWTDRSTADRSGHYEEAVAALVWAALDRPEAVDRSVQAVLVGHSTYIDRILALTARATTRLRRGDEAGCDAALADARRELEGTDDVTTRSMVELVSAMCGRGDVADAEQQMRNLGLDPAGWRTVWSLALQHSGSDR